MVSNRNEDQIKILGLTTMQKEKTWIPAEVRNILGLATGDQLIWQYIRFGEQRFLIVSKDVVIPPKDGFTIKDITLNMERENNVRRK